MKKKLKTPLRIAQSEPHLHAIQLELSSSNIHITCLPDLILNAYTHIIHVCGHWYCVCAYIWWDVSQKPT